MKFIRSLIVAAVVVFAGIYFGSNYLIASTFERWLGVKTSVGSVRWGFASQKMTIHNVRLSNFEGYGDHKLAQISKVTAEYDASGLTKGIFKIKRLEVFVDEVYLSKKSISETNVLELRPLKRVMGTGSEGVIKAPSVSFVIEKVRFQMDRVVFETQLGNDRVTENRKVEAPQTDLTELTTPDHVAVYAVLLALRSAGWQSFIPSKEQVVESVQTQVGVILEQLKQKAQVFQAQLQQTLAEKLKTAS